MQVWCQFGVQKAIKGIFVSQTQEIRMQEEVNFY